MSVSAADGGPRMPDPAGYEAPRVERVLTPAELEEEILYAGAPAPSPDFT